VIAARSAKCPYVNGGADLARAAWHAAAFWTDGRRGRGWNGFQTGHCNDVAILRLAW